MMTNFVVLKLWAFVKGNSQRFFQYKPTDEFKGCVYAFTQNVCRRDVNSYNDSSRMFLFLQFF